MNEKIARFFAEQQPATPCLVVDLDIVEENFRSLTAALPDAKIYYAVKANPAPEILSLLAAKGSSFDTASVPEIEMALAAGATPDRISFGNTIKKQRDIAKAYELGVRLFAFDSIEELEAALQSPERAASYEDGLKLPPFVGEIKRQTFEVLDFFSG